MLGFGGQQHALPLPQQQLFSAMGQAIAAAVLFTQQTMQPAAPAAAQAAPPGAPASAAATATATASAAPAALASADASEELARLRAENVALKAFEQEALRRQAQLEELKSQVRAEQELQQRQDAAKAAAKAAGKSGAVRGAEGAAEKGGAGCAGGAPKPSAPPAPAARPAGRRAMDPPSPQNLDQASRAAPPAGARRPARAATSPPAAEASALPWPRRPLSRRAPKPPHPKPPHHGLLHVYVFANLVRARRESGQEGKAKKAKPTASAVDAAAGGGAEETTRGPCAGFGSNAGKCGAFWPAKWNTPFCGPCTKLRKAASAQRPQQPAEGARACAPGRWGAPPRFEAWLPPQVAVVVVLAAADAMAVVAEAGEVGAAVVRGALLERATSPRQLRSRSRSSWRPWSRKQGRLQTPATPFFAVRPSFAEAHWGQRQSPT